MKPGCGTLKGQPTRGTGRLPDIRVRAASKGMGTLKPRRLCLSCGGNGDLQGGGLRVEWAGAPRKRYWLRLQGDGHLPGPEDSEWGLLRAGLLVAGCTHAQQAVPIPS